MNILELAKQAGLNDFGVAWQMPTLEAFAALIIAARDAELMAVGMEPEAIAHSWDGYGYLYIDNGSGSSWYEIGMSKPDAQPLFTTDHLRAAVLKERERCILQVKLNTPRNGPDSPENQRRDRIVEAIRKGEPC